jgi:hypothetical protein
MFTQKEADRRTCVRHNSLSMMTRAECVVTLVSDSASEDDGETLVTMVAWR